MTYIGKKGLNNAAKNILCIYLGQLDYFEVAECAMVNSKAYQRAYLMETMYASCARIDV